MNDIHEIRDEIDLLTYLRDSGILERDPYLKWLWKWAWDNQDCEPLIRLLNDTPGILMQAKRLYEEERSARRKNPLRPVPEGKEMELLAGDIRIGMVNHNREFSCLDPLDFTRGFFCCGPPGYGKTTLRLYILDQMLAIPPEERSYRILSIQDSKRDADYLARKYPYFKIIEYSDALRLAMNAVEPWDTFEEKRASNKKVFQNCNWFYQHSQLIYGNALKLCYDHYKKTGLPPTFEDILAQVPAAIEELGLSGFEHKNSIDHVTFALKTFAGTERILNCRAGFTIEDFWSKHDIILNIMDEDSDFVRRTLVQTLLIDLMRYYIKHPLKAKELRHFVDVDECMDIFPARGSTQTDHNPHRSMIDWVRLRRSSGMGYAAYTQFIESAPDWLIGASQYKVIFPIDGIDRDKAMKVLNLDERT
jgi:hypothetical protein